MVMLRLQMPLEGLQGVADMGRECIGPGLVAAIEA